MSLAKREKLARTWGAEVRDSFAMTEAGMMGRIDQGSQPGALPARLCSNSDFNAVRRIRRPPCKLTEHNGCVASENWTRNPRLVAEVLRIS